LTEKGVATVADYASGPCEDAVVERIVPGTDSFVWQAGSHIARYKFARSRVSSKRVLDAASGSGYGAEILARSAASVVGLELAREAVDYARRHRVPGRLEFLVADAHQSPFGNSVFDVIVSFETIEHLTDPEAFVAEAARVLRPGGELIASVPADTEELKRNPHHLHSFTASDLERLLRREFELLTIFTQVRSAPPLFHPIRAMRSLARVSGHLTRFLAPRPFEFHFVAFRDVGKGDSLLAVARKR